MGFWRFWSDLDMWSKVGLCFVAAVAIVFIVFMIT